jgi:TolB-like protein
MFGFLIMGIMPMDLRKKHIFLTSIFTILLVLTISCTPRKLFLPDAPEFISDRADYADCTLHIASFDVRNLEKVEDISTTNRLQERFLEYILSQNYFSEVHDFQKDRSDKPYLILKVEVLPEYSINRTWILDICTFYPCLGLWPITPHWGETMVNVKANLFDSKGNTLENIQINKQVEYSNIFYSYYSNTALEEAFKQCYDIVFTEFSSRLRENSTTIVKRIESAVEDQFVEKTITLPDDKSDKRTNIAVVDLRGYGISEMDALALTNRLTTELFKMGIFTVLEREKMQDILNEQGFQQSGCTTSECLVEAGKLLNVQQIVGGSVSKIGEFYTIELRMIDVESGKILSVANEDIEGSIGEVLTRGIRKTAIKLVR